MPKYIGVHLERVVYSRANTGKMDQRIQQRSPTLRYVYPLQRLRSQQRRGPGSLCGSSSAFAEVAQVATRVQTASIPIPRDVRSLAELIHSHQLLRSSFKPWIGSFGSQVWSMRAALGPKRENTKVCKGFRVREHCSSQGQEAEEYESPALHRHGISTGPGTCKKLGGCSVSKKGTFQAHKPES